MVKKIKKQVGGIIPRAGGNIAGGARPLGGVGVAGPLGRVGVAGAGALPGTRMVKKGGSIKAKHGGVIKKKKKR